MIIGGYDSSNQATGDVFWYGWSGEGSSVGRWTQLDSVDATLGTPACGLYRDPVSADRDVLWSRPDISSPVNHYFL